MQHDVCRGGLAQGDASLTPVQAPKTASFLVSRQMVMDLRRRNKQVMETMDGKSPAPTAHEFACAHGDFQVDGMDNIAEGRDETVEPLIQRRRVLPG